MSWSKRLMLASALRWSVGIGSALVEFHPALEQRLHAHWGVDTLEIAVLDVFLDPGPNLDQGLLLGGALARRLGCGPDAASDIARIFENRAAVEVIEVPAGRACLLGELAGLLVEGGKRVAEEHAARPVGRALAAADGGAGEALEACLQFGVGLKQRLVLEVHVLDRGFGALVGVIELLERGEVVLGSQKLLSLDPERLRDQQRLLRDLGVEREDRVQLVWRQEVPEAHRPAGAGDLHVVSDQPLLDLRIHAPVHAADALHQTHRVPVDVVVDHPRCVLEVQALGQDVCGNEDADLRAAFLRKRRRGEAVVVGREALDDVGAVTPGRRCRPGRHRRYRPGRVGASGSGRCRRTR